MKTSWRGIRRNSLDLATKQNEALLAGNTRFATNGELARRRGIARTNIIKKSNGVTSLSGFSAFQSNVMAALVDGANMQGYQQPAALWGDNPNYGTDTLAVMFPGQEGTTADRMYAIAIDAAGSAQTITWSTDVGYVVSFAWHAGTRTWMGFGGPAAPGKIYQSNTSTFPGPCPGVGWTEIYDHPFALEYVFDGFRNKRRCTMPDGGIMIAAQSGSGHELLWIRGADASVESISGAQVITAIGNTTKLFCPRGGTRVFAMTHLDGPALGYYADPPYTSWTAVTGLSVTDPFHHGWGEIVRSSATDLVAFRPWMSNGIGLGSQAEIWSSSDNGASWALASRPWGLFSSGDSVYHRGGTDPVFAHGRWWWTNAGDSLEIVLVSTADWTTFKSYRFPGRGYTNFLCPISASRGVITGRNPSAGYSNFQNMVTVNTSSGVISYNDGIAQVPASTRAANTWNVVALSDDRAWEYEI